MTHHNDGHRKRVMRRFLDGEEGHFESYELLEICLFIVLPRKDVRTLSKQLIKKFGSLSGVCAANPKELQKIEGIGDTTVTFLKLIKRLTEEFIYEKIKVRDAVTSIDDIFQLCRIKTMHMNREVILLVLLDSKRKIIDILEHSKGSINSSPIFFRDLINDILNHGATGLIMVHNHPSGNTQPSKSDIDMTVALKDHCNRLNIELIDHLIVGKYGYTSLKNMNII